MFFHNTFTGEESESPFIRLFPSLHTLSICVFSLGSESAIFDLVKKRRRLSRNRPKNKEILRTRRSWTDTTFSCVSH